MNDDDDPLGNSVVIGRLAWASLTLGMAAPDGYGGVRIPAQLDAEGSGGTSERVSSQMTIELDTSMGGGEPLARFFDGLAASWRGWDGPKIFDQIDGPFAMSATHDGVRLVRLSVSIVSDSGEPGAWRLRVEVPIEPGTLAEIARRVRTLVVVE